MSVLDVERTREEAAAVASSAWAGVTATNYRAEWPRVAPSLLSALLASRETVKANTELDLTARLTKKVGAAVSVVTVSERSIALTPAGVDPADLLLRTPFVIEARIGAGVDPVDAVSMAARWSSGLLESEPFRVQRAVIQEATSTDARFSGWVRVAEPGACSFCLALASRGAVYRTDGTALLTSRGSRYHLRCRCYASEVVDERVAQAIRRDGERAWLRQVSKGEGPLARSSLSPNVSGIRADLVGLPAAEQLRILRSRLSFYEDMASERSNIPGRKNYAASKAEGVRRLIARLDALSTP